MKKLILGIEIGIATLILGVATVGAATIGTESDPLVSKSYVDSKIEQVLSYITENANSSASVDTDAIVNEVMEKINSGELTGGSVDVSAYVPVSVAVGQTLVGGEGTEIILRAGKGEVSISGVDGIADITTGDELKNGSKATKNHLLIVPRDDGRGIEVTEAAWFLVKGEYTIE